MPHGIALISAILGIGGGLGIVLSGPIVQHLSYHWLFWLPLVGGPRRDGRHRCLRARVAGPRAGRASIRSAPFSWPDGSWRSSCPISEGPTWGWRSSRTLGLFAIAAVVFPGAWVWVESA